MNIYTIIGVSIYYKDEIKASWNKIVKVMTDFCGFKIKPIMNKILKKMEDLPGEDEFLNFSDHYDKHAKHFSYMPGGNGKKPNKKRYMVIKLLMNQIGQKKKHIAN